MKYLSALFAITLILCSCSTEPKSEYQGLYSAFEGNPSPETFKTLMDATIEKIRELEVADPERKEALETGYKASKQMNNTAQAVGFLNTYIRDYPEDPSTADKAAQVQKTCFKIWEAICFNLKKVSSIGKLREIM